MTLSDKEWALLELIAGKGGAAVGGDAYGGDYGIDNDVASDLERRRILDYRGFAEHWQWQLNDTSRKLLETRSGADR
ncbi:MAG: hypothetical protein K0U16_07390 [Gammaproteobacteria bacterium]|nr:hypothetical protein [Gammaproteobacteria bacterium]